MIHFYCFANDKLIIVSDLAIDKIKNQFGHRFEILTSVKDKESVPIILPRIIRSYPGYVVREKFKKVPFFSEESRKKISESKRNKPRDEATRAKISAALKGRSNFQGKKHSEETKKVMAERKLGNDHVKDRIWAHNPRGDDEVRVKELKDIPKGFSKGRDYYSTEPGFYHFKLRSSNR